MARPRTQTARRAGTRPSAVATLAESAHGAAAWLLLDQLRPAILLTTLDLRVVFANRAARGILCRDGLAIRGGRLVASDVREKGKLEALARRLAARALDGSPDAGSIVIALLPCGRHRRPLSVAMVVLIGPPDKETLLGLLLVDPDAMPDVSEEMLRHLHGLTPAEAKLARCLLATTSIGAAARRLGVSPHTARNQVRSLFAKTRTRRQVELLLLLAGGAAAFVLPGALSSHTLQ